MASTPDTDSSRARRRPELFVVDGSNIATEGRTVPSLEQLNEAVLAFLDANPKAVVTVVVDATFGHRIDKREVKAFDEAVANNELVTPPAGAVGRGDAFVLAIADRAGAGILSNDSFQEFHGDYEWLFDDGRLIGGKPVPHVGWVFVERSPVRGPKSRQAVRAASGDVAATKLRANRRVRKKAADEVEPVVAETVEVPQPVVAASVDQQSPAGPAPAKGPVNDVVAFLEFVQRHPVGTSCSAVVESYSSHGAYARAGDVLVYVPLRLMGDPPPRSARSALALGEAITTVIVRYVPDRRSIDAALPHMAEHALGAPSGGAGVAPAEEPTERPAKASAAKKA
ncbi:MAG: NYN domain-containing protein, partial [Ilumatobacteraceae bacterium]